ncbi:M20/M25/M40 family metallo-hydrolase [Marinifilum flexuosum]|uniref:Carboxypeptidase Q n=1 Tax=Marinifilum flexuosum TaxID=1117708 RepID=A0A419WKV9_9BACT|nr:M20/M25/M40 family metallo-hydrolase [Marinifilum flexuosum]RKD96067.1 peptidase M28-like protein [Marinifilum flexuosum]
MKRKLKLILIAIFILAVHNSYAQKDPVVKKIIEIGKTNNQCMDHLDILSNRFGGRLIGSNAYDNSAAWAASKFKEWGMEVIMDEVGSLPVGFNRGPWFGRMLGGDNMHLHFATPSYTVGTKGVQKGHVLLEPKTQRQFDRMKGKLKGAWVLIGGQNKGWPIDYSEKAEERRAEIRAENAKIEKKNDSIRRINWRNRHGEQVELIPLKEEPALFYKQMVDAGILGIIQSAKLPIAAMYDRKNLMDMTFETLPEIPDIKLNEHQYKTIAQMTKERQRFELEFDIRNHFRMGPVKYHSVIGVIKGSKYPNEYVIMGGHLDAFDIATGGVDNGSGVSPAMEAARLIIKAGGKPKRTILVCLWAGEEFGLLGAKHWIKTNPEKLDKIANMFNRDSGPTATTSLSVTEAMWDDMEKICKPLSTINPDIPFTLKKRQATKRPKTPWGTDSGPFAVAGVPTMEFGKTDHFGYDFSYREIWHTERDLYNMSIAEYQEHSSIVTAVVVYGIANLNHLLSREGYYIEEGDKKEMTEK